MKTIEYGMKTFNCEEVAFGHGEEVKHSPSNPPVVGEAVTIWLNGNEYPYTVVSVERNGKKIGIRSCVHTIDEKTKEIHLWDRVEDDADEYVTFRPSRGQYIPEKSKTNEWLRPHACFGYRGFDIDFD